MTSTAVILLVFGFLLGVANGFSKSERAVTVVNPTGTISSEGYPNSYDSTSSESWRLRVPGATRYVITFEDMDLDVTGCYDYIVLYNDNNYIAPGQNFCDNPGIPIVMETDKMTVSFVTGSDWAAGPRGAGFSLTYTAEGNGVATTTSATISSSTGTTVVTSETSTTSGSSGSSSTEPSTTTTKDPATSTTTTANTPPSGGNFPPGLQDDSQCGAPVAKPVITGFDYEAQGSLVSFQQPSTKVVNGETAVPHSWPWQVSLQGSYGQAYCGGTLVHPQWVVTAAHCAALIFVGTYGSDQVGLGMHNKNVQEDSQQLIDVMAVYTHPQYDNPDRSHDVAMVKLKTPAVLNDKVSLACEAHAGWTFPAGMQCVVTGWGVTEEGGNRGTNILQQATLPLLGDQACYDLYQQANLDTTQDMQCAGGVGKGACNGDSGGPLNCYVNGRWYHMGIVSFGEASCDTEIASVFARVAELREFIDSTIEQYS